MEKKYYDLLLIEDNDGHSELIRNNLRKHGIPINVIRLSDGEQALDYVFNRGEYEDSRKYPAPHIILLDLRLPKVDGTQVLKQIKSDECLKRIPVIILTTSEVKDDIKNAYEYNANSFLVKPIDFNHFVEMMRDFVNYWFKWNKQ